MSASTLVILNTEFWLLWSVRQLLRGIAIGIGITSAMVTVMLFTVAGALGNSLEALQDRTHVTAFPRNTTGHAHS